MGDWGGGREGRRRRRGQYPPPVLVLLVLPASGGASSGRFRESGGSRSMGTPVWVPFCWIGAAAIMFAAAAGRITAFSLQAGRGEGGGGKGLVPLLSLFLVSDYFRLIWEINAPKNAGCGGEREKGLFIWQQ